MNFPFTKVSETTVFLLDKKDRNIDQYDLISVDKSTDLFRPSAHSFTLKGLHFLKRGNFKAV